MNVDVPAMVPVWPASTLLRNMAKLAELIGHRIVVSGKVKSTGVTDINARLFWGVPQGLGRVGLADNLEADQPQAMCVFPKNSVGGLEAEDACRIEGEYRGPIPTAGIPLLIDCEVAR